MVRLSSRRSFPENRYDLSEGNERVRGEGLGLEEKGGDEKCETVMRERNLSELMALLSEILEWVSFSHRSIRAA